MKKISLILVLMLATLLAAQSPQDLYQKLSSRYANLSSFQADVSQENHFVQINKTMRYTGKLYFQKDRMLMSFSSPSVQRLKIQNGYAELYDADSKTLFKSKVEPQFNKMNPIEILEHFWQKSEVKILETKDGKSRVRLTPAKDPLISSLEATLDNRSGIVSKLSYTDKSSNRVSYSFSNISTDKPIPPSVWNFSYPKGIQVIEQ